MRFKTILKVLLLIVLLILLAAACVVAFVKSKERGPWHKDRLLSSVIYHLISG